VCITLDTKCGYHCKIQRFFGACGTAECFDFVAEIGFVVGINYVFAVAEFHFANVDYIVAAHNYKVDLTAATAVFFVKPHRTFGKYVADSYRLAQLRDVAFAKEFKGVSCPRPPHRIVDGQGPKMFVPAAAPFYKTEIKQRVEVAELIYRVFFFEPK